VNNVAFKYFPNSRHINTSQDELKFDFTFPNTVNSTWHIFQTVTVQNNQQSNALWLYLTI